MRHSMSSNFESTIVVRRAGSSDREALLQLAELDSASSPRGPVIVGEVDGELRAAIELESGRAIADPFHPTAELVTLLQARARQLQATRHRSLRLVARTPDHSRPSAAELAAG